MKSPTPQINTAAQARNGRILSILGGILMMFGPLSVFMLLAGFSTRPGPLVFVPAALPPAALGFFLMMKGNRAVSAASMRQIGDLGFEQAPQRNGAMSTPSLDPYEQIPPALLPSLEMIEKAWVRSEDRSTVRLAEFTVPAGKSSVSFHIVSVPGAPWWPVLDLRRENMFSDKLAKKFGRMDELQLENERFNKRWMIRTDDKDFAATLLSPQVQEHFDTLVDRNISPAVHAVVTTAGWLHMIWGGQLKAKNIAGAEREIGDLVALLEPRILSR